MLRLPPWTWTRNAAKWTDPMPVAWRLPASTSLSVIVNENPLEFSSVAMEPLIFDRDTTTFAARITRSQLIVFASMVTVTVMVQGPVYAVRVVPAGMPVVAALGQPRGTEVVVVAGSVVLVVDVVLEVVDVLEVVLVVLDVLDVDVLLLDVGGVVVVVDVVVVDEVVVEDAVVVVEGGGQ